MESRQICPTFLSPVLQRRDEEGECLQAFRVICIVLNRDREVVLLSLHGILRDRHFECDSNVVWLIRSTKLVILACFFPFIIEVDLIQLSSQRSPLLSSPLLVAPSPDRDERELLLPYRGGFGGRAPNSGTCTLIAESAGKWGTKERRRWARVPAPTCTFGVQVHDFRPEPKVHMKLPPCAIHVYYHHLLRNHIVSATNASRNRFVDRQLRETSPCRALA